MWKTIKFLSLLIKLNAPNISGYEITMNIFIEKSSNYRTFRFSSSTTSSKTVSTGLRKRLVDSQTGSSQPARGSGTAFRFFSRIPRDWLQQHRSLIAQMISSSVLRGENRGTRTNTQRYIYICISVVVSEQRCAIGSGNGFLPLRRTLLYFTDSRRFSPRNATTFLLSTYSWCLSRASMYTRQTRLSCRWENFNRVERILEWVIGRYREGKKKEKKKKEIVPWS